MVYSLEWYSDEQIKKVNRYVNLLDRKDVVPAYSMDDEEFEAEVLKILIIIEAFGNCPDKAAFAFKSAKKKACAAMDATYEVMMAHIPKPTSEHFYSSFPTIEQADAFKAKVQEEAGKAYSEVMERDFYSIYTEYKLQQLNGTYTLH